MRSCPSTKIFSPFVRLPDISASFCQQTTSILPEGWLNPPFISTQNLVIGVPSTENFASGLERMVPIKTILLRPATNLPLLPQQRVQLLTLLLIPFGLRTHAKSDA